MTNLVNKQEMVKSTALLRTPKMKESLVSNHELKISRLNQIHRLPVASSVKSQAGRVRLTSPLTEKAFLKISELKTLMVSIVKGIEGD